MECSRAWKCISLSSSSLEFNTCEVVLKMFPVELGKLLYSQAFQRIDSGFWTSPRGSL